MTFKGSLKQTWRFLALVVGLTLLSMIARALLPQAAIVTHMAAPADPTKSFLSLVFVYALYALVMQYIAFFARIGGWRLFVALDSLYAGCGSIMLQIETLYFGGAFPQLSSADTLLLMLDGVAVGTVFSALVVTVMGKWSKGDDTAPSLGSAYRASWKSVIAGMIAYPLIYFLFGFFVAYGSHATVQFYAAASQATGSSLLLLGFQILRGALWVVFIVPIVSVLARREQAVAGGLPLFSGMALIFENPVMPEAVRFAHGFELTSSMTLFGILAALSLTSAGSLLASRGNDRQPESP